MALDKKSNQQMVKDFGEKLSEMLELIAQGRGIEILIRIAEQTKGALSAADESYQAMMNSRLSFPSSHPRSGSEILFSDPEERERVELARDVADKLAHGLCRQARKIIREYEKSYGLKTKLNEDGVIGWQIHASGHLIEEDGRKIESIVDVIRSSDDNVIWEEFQVFVHNKYAEAAKEIFDDAWKRIGSGKGDLAIEVMRLDMFRGFKRGERKYLDQE